MFEPSRYSNSGKVNCDSPRRTRDVSRRAASARSCRVTSSDNHRVHWSHLPAPESTFRGIMGNIISPEDVVLCTPK